MNIPFRYIDTGESLWSDPEAPDKRSDCAVLALSIGLNRNYRAVWIELNRKMGDKTPEIGVNSVIIRNYLKELGWDHHKVNLNLEDLITIFEIYPNPIIFRVKIGRKRYHLSVLKDGKVHDRYKWWDLLRINPKSIKITDVFIPPIAS